MYKICFQSKNITKLGLGLGWTSNSPVIYGFDMLWLKNTLVDWLIMVNRVAPFHHMLHQCLSFSHEGFLAVPAFSNIFKRIPMGIITLLIPLRRTWAFNRVPRTSRVPRGPQHTCSLATVMWTSIRPRAHVHLSDVSRDTGRYVGNCTRNMVENAHKPHIYIYYFCGIAWVYWGSKLSIVLSCT